MPLHIDIYFWCAFQIFVFFKLMSNVFLQERARKAANIVRYAEDQRKAVSSVVNESDNDRVVRATNLFRNDLENILPFSFIALAAAFVQVDARIYLSLLVLYMIARVGHSAALIGAHQPWRSLSYIVGQICAFAFLILMIVRLIAIFQTY